MRINKNNKKVEDINIFDEEESNIHLIQLKGKIIRDCVCPLGKILPCEDCEEFYDGWGVDTVNYCNNPNIVDGKSLKLSVIKGKREEKKKRREKRFKNTPMGRSKIPERAGEYDLLDNRGNIIYSGRANNLKRKIKEEHYDKTKIFSYIKIRIEKKKKEEK